MWDYGAHMGGMMWFGWLVFILLLALGVWAVLAVSSTRVQAGDGSDPERVLKGRYARGEIDREEYQRRLDDLRK